MLITGKGCHLDRLIGLGKIIVLCIIFSSSVCAHAKNERYYFNINEETLAKGLAAVVKQTEALVLYPPELANTKGMKPVIGRYTIDEALSIMLSNTEFFGGLTERGVIVISRQNNHRVGRDMNSKKNLLAATVAFFVGSNASGVMAQEKVGAEEHSGIDEIVVTAQRREQRLIDVPISITAIGEETIKNTGIKTVADLSYHVSNFSVYDYGTGASDYFIRGVANGFGSSPLIGVYLDEMPLSLALFLPVPLQTTDIKRVEVLKGPQGTLFGQGSVGGAIRYVTNSPNLEDFEGSVGASLFDTNEGNFSEELTGVFNIPVVTDRLAFRVAAKYSDQGGWIDQPTLDKEDVNDSLLQDIRITGLWHVSDKFDVKVMSNRYRESMGAANDTNGSESSTSYHIPLVNDFDVASIGTGIENSFDLNNVELNYDFGNFRLMSSTSTVEGESIRRVQSFGWEFAFTIAGEDGADFVRPLYALDTKGFSQELRLVGETEVLNWTVGALYADVENGFQQTSGIYSSGDLLFGGDGPNMSTSNEDSKSQAIYGELSYDMSEKTTVSLGSRYFKDDRNYESTFSGGNLSGSFDKVSSSFKVSYAATDNSNIYLNVSEGFRSGGFNDNGVTFKPESLISYDFGAKATFLDGRLGVDGAIFHSDYEDFQSLESITLGSASATVTGNSAKVEMEGLELSVQFNVVDNLNVSFSGGVLNAEVVKTHPSVTSVLPGDSVKNIPKYSYSAMLDYDFTWSPSVAGFFHLDYARSGKREAGTRTGAFARTVEGSDIGFLNIHLGAKTDNFTVRLFSNNLANELRSQISNYIAPTHNQQRRPRTVGFDINYDF